MVVFQHCLDQIAMSLCRRREREMQRKEAEEARERKKQAFLRWVMQPAALLYLAGNWRLPGTHSLATSNLCIYCCVNTVHGHHD